MVEVNSIISIKGEIFNALNFFFKYVELTIVIISKLINTDSNVNGDFKNLKYEYAFVFIKSLNFQILLC